MSANTYLDRVHNKNSENLQNANLPKSFTIRQELESSSSKTASPFPCYRPAVFRSLAWKQLNDKPASATGNRHWRYPQRTLKLGFLASVVSETRRRGAAGTGEAGDVTASFRDSAQMRSYWASWPCGGSRYVMFVRGKLGTCRISYFGIRFVIFRFLVLERLFVRCLKRYGGMC